MKCQYCYLYVLPLPSEDLLKIGISNDPLSRCRAFSSRYYDAFDLPRSLLIAFDARAEAQRRETALHRQLRLLNAMQPVTVPTRAGGGTEWYRGAYATAVEEVQRDGRAGRVIHSPALDWWRARLQSERDMLYEWSSELLRGLALDALLPQQRRAIVDVLDGWAALDLEIDDVLPDELRVWYQAYRRGFRAAGPLGD